MRRLIRSRRHQDRGAAATLFAVLLAGGVLLGMAALSIDVGQLYAERRQVQNGADAAALAVAVTCATGTTCDTSTGGQARTMANSNANDSSTSVLTVCGAGHANLAACGANAGTTLTQCPAPPTGVQGWVRVRTGTASAAGTLLPPTFARTLVGNTGYRGVQVGACAQAAWGSPVSIQQATPLTISACEWDAATHSGTTYAAPPPYPPYPAGAEVALKFHAAGDHTGCPARSAYSDLPGGFGWLDTTGCTITVSSSGTVSANTGVGNSCSDVVASQVGKIIYVAVYDSAVGTGTGGRYTIKGLAAFYLTGYNLPSAHPKKVSSPVGGDLCNGNNVCIYGWFTQALVKDTTTMSGVPSLGAKVVALKG